MKVEYRVRETKRFQVTRHFETEGGHTGGTSQKGEYDNAEVAYEVAYALCRAEHEQLGYPPGDERVQYPKAIVPTGNTAINAVRDMKAASS
jgi:hypothetical protein